MTGYTRITKAEFYNAGGFSNPAQHRKQKGTAWAYYRKA